ncbi:MAG: ABC transporter permease [Actinomycetia bacterium]|nr:ABC transporter permease [Actinomycetes bacterium]
MSTTATDTEAALVAAQRRRDSRTGIIWLVTGTAVIWLFALGTPSGDESTFQIAVDPDGFLSLPSFWTSMVIGTAIVVLAVVQLARPLPHTAGIGVVVLVMAVIAFLVWASAGQQFSLVGMLESTVTRATPLALGALAGVLCERSGVVNIAIEGMMLFSAFVASFAASASGNLWLGMAVGVIGGGMLAWGHAGLSVTYRVDQIISGTTINFFATGITAYLAASVLTTNPELNRAGTFDRWKIPLLGDIPFLGEVLFDNNIFVYLMYFLLPFTTWMLFRSRWGLRVRSVGEHPKAADTVGINVLRTRYRSVVMGGMAAGLAGAFLPLGSTGSFQEDMTAGRGFIALAIMIFGRWNPMGALGAALLFGFAESLNTKLVVLGTPIPSEFLLMAPYIVTLFVVAGFGGRARPPAADGQPYETN